MDALFDQLRRHIGWHFRNRHIYDTELRWVAYIANFNAWAVSNNEWLGPVVGYNCLDRLGRVVAWHPGQPVRNLYLPVYPGKPDRPVSPTRPLLPPAPVIPDPPHQPFGGWSPLSWQDWLAARYEPQRGSG